VWLLVTGPNSLAFRVRYMNGPVYRVSVLRTYKEIHILKMTVLCNTINFWYLHRAVVQTVVDLIPRRPVFNTRLFLVGVSGG
jgi:hypothetical protein